MLNKVVLTLFVFLILALSNCALAGGGGGGGGGSSSSVPFMHPLLNGLLIVVIALFYKFKK